MTLTITGTKAAIREQELREDLEHSKAEEADYLTNVKNPNRRETPYRTLSEIRESIEVLGLKHDEATRAADSERTKLPEADKARKLIDSARDEESTARQNFYTAVDAAKTALNALDRASRGHRNCINASINNLRNAGIPVIGAELDGEPIDLRHGTIEHGATVLRAVNKPIDYKWAPSLVSRPISREAGAA